MPPSRRESQLQLAVGRPAGIRLALTPAMTSTSRNERLLLGGQGAFYLAAGLWPVVHRSSFERVTGPKTDFWLVRTVGSLLAVMGSTMMLGALRDQSGPETRSLAIGTAGAITAIDAVYVKRGRISPIYLLDAATQLGLMAAWAVTLLGGRKQPRGPFRMVA
jgi:hypothetical protein